MLLAAPVGQDCDRMYRFELKGPGIAPSTGVWQRGSVYGAPLGHMESTGCTSVSSGLVER